MKQQSVIPSAITTRWRGYSFRSRLEARWAVFFTKLGLAFEYEPETFNLGDFWYLPDFYFPKIDMYGEVKPKEFTRLEIRKCVELAYKTGRGVLTLDGAPDFRPYKGIWAEDSALADRECVLDIYAFDGHYYNKDFLYCNPSQFDFRTRIHFSRQYVAAVYAARAERFGA